MTGGALLFGTDMESLKKICDKATLALQYAGLIFFLTVAQKFNSILTHL